MRYDGQKPIKSSARIAIATAVACAFASPSVAAENARAAGRAANYEVAGLKLPRPAIDGATNRLVPVLMRPARPDMPPVDPNRVLVIQSALVAKGCYDGAIDAQWNDSMRRVVARAARALNLNVDVGRPDDALVEALLKRQVGSCSTTVSARPPEYTPASYGAPNSAPESPSAGIVTPSRRSGIGRESAFAELNPSLVTTLQAALVARNCFSGAIDGRWSEATLSALMAFSRISGVAVSDATLGSGLVDRVLRTPSAACAAGLEPRIVKKRRSGKSRKSVASSRRASPNKRRTVVRTRFKVRRATARRRGTARKRRTAQLHLRRRGPAAFIRPVGIGRF